MGGSGVGAYIAQVDRVLASAQGVFPAAGGPGSVSSQGPGVPAAPADSALSTGAGNAGDGYKRTWGTVTGLDAHTNGTSAAGAAEGQNGRAGATGVRQSAASTAAAIAPATGSPAGVKTLVTSMDDRLAAMQRQIESTKAQNQLLATRMRQMAMAYRQAAQASPASMFRGMGGGMGGGGGMPSMGMGGGGGGFPGMGMFSKLPGMLTGQNSRQASEQLTSDLFGRDGNGSDRANRAVAFAKSKLGAPYVWGAEGPNAFDCSGLTQWAYRQAGVNIPRTTYDLVNAGTPVSRENIRAGDLILCNWQKGQPEHVVMAVSPTTVIEAPNRHERVKFSPIPSGHLVIRRVA
ncbi:C40 family peptidase [Mycolicibacterium sp. J2]|uniref:C40 family peptidase n=1 Tax=Mycolicibacterium sp. J2 TaxID=2993511 RepID=UPI00224A8C7D|nr:C40 family peptidase [Mycolicibacterium sp. J2]MCX2715620.1 NlpC/P60 family protein [Mycolicibacterium sp. J2]